MPVIPEMTVGQMFERLFKLIGATFTRVGMLGLVLIVPVIVLISVALTVVVDRFTDMIDPMGYAGGVPSPGPADILAVALGGGLLGLLVAALTVIFTVGVIVLMCSTMEEEDLTWQEALRLALSLRSLKLIAAHMLLGFGIAAAFVVIIIAGVVSEVPALFLLFIVLIPGIIWLVFRWIFVTQSVAWEDAGVLQAFNRSGYLTTGLWWRVFLLTLLFSLVSQFALNIISTPIMLLGMSGFFASYVDLILTASSNQPPDPSQIVALFSSLGIGAAVSISIVAFLSSIVQNAYAVVIYYDARARKGEFRAPAAPEDGEDAPIDLDALNEA